MIPNFEQSVHTRLSGDGALSAIVTGGIYQHNLMALNKTSFSQVTAAIRNATTGKFVPWVSVHGREVISTDEIRDNNYQYTTMEQTVEVWVIDDPTSAPTASINAVNRIYTLLQHRPPTGAFQMELVYTDKMRDPDFANARMTVTEWLITAYLGG